MARMHTWIGMAALSILIGGCTSTDKYTAVKLENEELRAKLGDAEAKARTASAERDLLKNQLTSISDGQAGRDGLVINLNKQISDLQAENTDLKRRYEEQIAKGIGSGIALPPQLSSALDDFAKQNGDLVDFDSARGMVKFKSDVTFATGSADVTDKAKSAIARFAQILNSDAARSYELMVAGHTDDTPVVNPNTKAKHPNNWYLSAHRAISVADTLMAQSINPQRVGVVGYGDQRPIAPNSSAAGKGQNRRVEVVILPSVVRSGIAKSTPAKTGTGAAKKTLNKDTTVAPVDKGPAYNK